MRTHEEIQSRLNEIQSMLSGEARDGMDFAALTTEVRALKAEDAEILARAEAEAEVRSAIASGSVATAPVRKMESNPTMSDVDRRAAEFAQTGRVEFRAIVNADTIVKPTKAGGLNGLADDTSGLIDDFHSIPMDGAGAYVTGYLASHATAADVTDGDEIGGNEGQYNVVTISPAQWGTYSRVSRTLKQLSPVAYLEAVQNDSVYALRAKAEAKAITAITGSTIAEKLYSKSLNQNYLRDLFLNYHAIAGKGAVALYINRTDLSTLCAVRGTNEKKPLYEISFAEGSTTRGTIKEGGFACAFRISDALTTGTQLFGQPYTVEMPMWGNFEIDTDESVHFKYNQIGVRGLQMANVALTSYHGMQVISQNAAPVAADDTDET